VVGIGASAGGLEALDLFFRNVPETSGAAFVVVQHLDPTHKGMLVELLQRATPMRVQQVKDRTRVEPNKVYVIPPDNDLSILHGVLHLLPPVAPRGLRLPIDFFFRSLGADQQARAIGVVLSGMGSDGMLGLRAIKQQAGGTFVQTPESAKFDGMPRSAIGAGLADVVAPALELPARITAYLAHFQPVASSSIVLSTRTQGDIEKVCALLRSQTGHDFSQYKRSAVYRRIERRMALQQLDRMTDYVRYMRENPQETELLFNELLIGVTTFFRDAAAWEHLEKVAIPALLRERGGGGVALRAWVAGCSTGEEAYSLAIAFKEVLARLSPGENSSLRIFATDLDKDAVDRARHGFYPSIADDVSSERLQKYFVPEGEGYRVAPQIRDMVTFAIQNVISDPPFTKLDILCCRNLLIYLGPELQKQVSDIFHYSLNPGGILFLGSAETVGDATDAFSPIGGKTRIYRRSDAQPRREPTDFPSSFQARSRSPGVAAAPKAAPANLQALVERELLSRYSPAAVLTSDQGDILYISGRTGKYLEPAAGKANWNIHAMARGGLRQCLHGMFQNALREKRRIDKTTVELEAGDSAAIVEVTIDLLQAPEALRGTVLVVFADVASRRVVKGRGKALKAPSASASRLAQALQQTRAELQTSREEMQSSAEEVRSSNEELQSTNEELQSTNEELTTSKEEMQSLNEELQTLNHELQAKLDELSSTNDDMRNLLDSTDIATLFLDDSLRVRRFTPQMTKIIKLIPGDANRPITDLASALIYPELVADARSVLQTLAVKERPIKAIDGRWFTVRIMPYRSMEDRIGGVVITFLDITAAKTLEAALRKRQIEYEA
jgi:two-component system CheB/CheR fusion protein